LAGHADPIYKSWGYKILGKSWGHLKVHVVWSTCYSTKLLIDLTSAFVLGLYPIHFNPCHFPLHIVVVRKKQSQGLKIQHGDGSSQIEKSLLLGGSYSWYKLGVVWKVTTKLQLGKGLFPVHLSSSHRELNNVLSIPASSFTPFPCKGWWYDSNRVHIYKHCFPIKQQQWMFELQRPHHSIPTSDHGGVSASRYQYNF
jgi:hypothetical protein